MSQRKPVHPIRRMQMAAQRCETEARERVSLARSVKPLLDALVAEHLAANDGRSRFKAGCPICQLIASWRAKL